MSYIYTKALAAQQGCKTLTVACSKHKTIVPRLWSYDAETADVTKTDII